MGARHVHSVRAHSDEAAARTEIVRSAAAVNRESTRSLGARLIVIAGATCITLLAVFVGGEILVRYREIHRATVPGTMPLLFYRHERLKHALVRNMNYFGWVHTDANGLRVTPRADPAAVPALRIIADGGSTTFDGSTGGDDRTWPARLQYWIAQFAPGAPVEVANAGVPGYRVVDNLIRLQTELYRLRPDVIILLQGHNDLFASLRYDTASPPSDPSRPGEITNYSFVRSWLSKHSLFYAKVQDRLNVFSFLSRGHQSLERAAMAPATFDTRLAAGAQRFERDLRGYVAIAHALGIRVVLSTVVHVTAPTASTASGIEATTWRNAIPFAPPEVVLKGYSIYNEIIRKVANETGVVYVDARAFGLYGERFYDEGDPVHFNTEGADTMGRTLAQALIDAHVVPIAAASASATSVPEQVQ
jgi:lysophospholipase L1-like esterase